MGSGTLAETGLTALGAVHHHSLLIEVEIDECTLTLVVRQFYTHGLGSSVSDVGFHLKGTFAAQRLHLTLAVELKIAYFNGLLTQYLHFLNGICREIVLAILLIHTQLAGQGVAAAELLCRSEVGILPVVHPWHCHDAVAKIGECNGSIMILAKVEEFDHFRLIVASEVLAIEVAHEIFRA